MSQRAVNLAGHIRRNMNLPDSVVLSDPGEADDADGAAAGEVGADVTFAGAGMIGCSGAGMGDVGDAGADMM